MIAIYIDNNLNKFRREIEFTVDFIFRTLGMEYKYIHKLHELKSNDLLILYSFIRPNLKEAYVLAIHKILIFIPFCSSFFLKQTNENKKNSELVEQKVNKHSSVWVEMEFDQPEFTQKRSDIYFTSFNFDLIGNIFLQLFLARGSRDKSISSKSLPTPQDSRKPGINLLLIYLEDLISRAVKNFNGYFMIKKQFWPQDQNSAIIISHSVNSLRKWTFKKIIKSTLKNFLILYELKFLLRDLISKLKFIFTNLEQYWNFDLIDEIERKYGIRSTYFWGVYSEGFSGVDYNISDPNCKNEILDQINWGNEVALLATSDSAKSDQQINQKKKLQKLIKQEIEGLRIMTNKFKPDLTIELLNKNGFQYDSTINQDKINGFPNGIGFPYYPYYEIDREENNNSFIRRFCLEIPQVFSDHNLKLSRYKIVELTQAEQIIAELVENAELGRALLTFDFSLPNFADISYNKYLYEYLLQIIKTKDFFLATMKELNAWWKQRQSVKLKELDRGFDIYFPEKIDHFTLTFTSSSYKLNTEQCPCKVVNNCLFFSNIKSNSHYKIFLDKL